MNYLRCEGPIELDPSGFPLCATGWQSVPEDVLLSATPIKQLFELLNAVFAQPSNEQLAAAFFAAFSLPLMLYLVAWGYKSVLKFFR